MLTAEVPGVGSTLGGVDGLHLVPVATGLSDFEAKLLAAQLGAEGILWQTRGIVDSIYPFGGIDVLVPTDQLDEARQAVVAFGDRAALGGAPAADGDLDADRGRGDLPVDLGAGGPSIGRGDERDARPSRWLGFVAIGAMAAFVLVRALTVI